MLVDVASSRKEKHYGKHLVGDTDEQLERLMGAKTETLGETVEGRTGTEDSEPTERNREEIGGGSATV